MSKIKRLRVIDNFTNLAFLANEYLCLAAVIGGTILFCEYRGSWGLSWAWDIPVVTLAVVLIGGNPAPPGRDWATKLLLHPAQEQVPQRLHRRCLLHVPDYRVAASLSPVPPGAPPILRMTRNAIRTS